MGGLPLWALLLLMLLLLLVVVYRRPGESSQDALVDKVMGPDQVPPTTYRYPSIDWPPPAAAACLRTEGGLVTWWVGGVLLQLCQLMSESDYVLVAAALTPETR